jgi:hypothetical protein
MNQWAEKRINDSQENQAKSMPCHVTKVDKDFIYVAFENKNSIFTMPTVKIPKSNSQYAREPTQQGDKGYAVPGNYYLGGVTGDAGGNTDFYPRGNLTTLSFNGVSHKQNPDRDYDQLTHMAGPNGWVASAFQQQQQDQSSGQQNGGTGNGGTTTTTSRVAPVTRTRQFSQPIHMPGQPIRLRGVQPPAVKPAAGIPPVLTGIIGGLLGGGGLGGLLGGQQGGQQQQDKTLFSFDKNGKSLVQSKDEKHQVVVDQQGKKIALNVPTSEKVYTGGDGSQGKYAQVITKDGPSLNTYARIG